MQNFACMKILHECSPDLVGFDSLNAQKCYKGIVDHRFSYEYGKIDGERNIVVKKVEN